MERCARAFALFADDIIRHEEGGKVTIVGVYSSDIEVGASAPTHLPLAIMVSVVGPTDTPIRLIRTEFSLDGNCFHMHTLGEAEIARTLPKHLQEMAAITKLAGEDSVDGVLLAAGMFRIVVPVRKPETLLRVTSDIGGGAIDAGCVVIRTVRENAARPE